MHVITNFSAPAGAETMLARILSRSQDPRIVVVSLIDVSERNTRLAANPSVHFVGLGAHGGLSTLSAVGRLARLIAQERPKVIVCWMYHAMIAGTLAAMLAGARHPVVWNIRQSLDDPASLSASSRRAVALARWLSWQPSGFIFNSARALTLHKARGYRLRNEVVIPNGVDMPKAPNPLPRSVKRIGIAARFHPQKDHETFFKAAALLRKADRQISFAAAGKGLSCDNRQIIDLISAAGLKAHDVELLGEVEDMGAFYRSIDILALSSRTEGFPNVLAEAMSYGVPVVATDVGDARLVTGKGGLIVPPQDPAALANALTSIIDCDQVDYSAYALAARSRVRAEFDIGAVVRRYEDFLGSIRDAAAHRH